MRAAFLLYIVFPIGNNKQNNDNKYIQLLKNINITI